jgi:hypothetical protein
MRRRAYILPALLLGAAIVGCNNVTPADVTQEVVTPTGFDMTLQSAKAKIEAQMLDTPVIPIPKDAGGGYTHEKHKDNAKLIYDAGQIYKLTGEKAFADFAAKLMIGYADVYPDWELHPEQKEQSPGRMFWQNLNESWWLVHVSQSYGAIKDTLSEDQKAHIETNLLRNMANFLSVEAPETFDKIHNHGTWATAAVGLTGYAIGDQNYVEQALLGLDKSGKAGFLKQMDVLFSPDGYYNEGPYYQRYALMPFVVFAHAVNKNNPEKKIFEKRDGILKKAIFTTIQQSYGGLFFPINDAIKDKDIATTELLHGVAIAYDLTGDEGLLSIAEAQGKFVLTPESQKVSRDLAAGKAKPFDFKSMRLSDGADGTQGALDILRASSDPNDLTVVAKNTSQGLGHGHFDKMGLLIYDQGHEIIRDYGAARFLNVEAKYGGHYLPENNAYAKQTIAHNALVVDEESHFKGVTATGNEFAPTLGTFTGEGDLKITSAEIDTAYDGVLLRRTVALINDKIFPIPVVVDVMQAQSDEAHQYDLPFHYNGQVTDTNFVLEADPVSRSPLGTKNGYQYLWKVAESRAVDGLSQFTFLKDRRFYTVTSAVADNTDVIIAETGANDPNINLRREPAFILRSWIDGDVTFASVIEPHGEYNPTVEYTLNSHSHIKTVSHFAGEGSDYVEIETKNGDRVGLALAQQADTDREHTIEANGKTVSWTGPHKLFTSDMLSE